jgi:hypothetical protein
VNAYTLGQLKDLRPQLLTDTSPPPVEVRVAVYCGYPPVFDEEWIGDIAHSTDSDTVYFQLYGRHPE